MVWIGGVCIKCFSSDIVWNNFILVWPTESKYFKIFTNLYYRQFRKKVIDASQPQSLLPPSPFPNPARYSPNSQPRKTSNANPLSLTIFPTQCDDEEIEPQSSIILRSHTTILPVLAAQPHRGMLPIARAKTMVTGTNQPERPVMEYKNGECFSPHSPIVVQTLAYWVLLFIPTDSGAHTGLLSASLHTHW